VFAAAATAPSELDPTAWFQLVLGADSPDPKSVRRLFELLMRECSSCEQCLELGVPAIPDTDDEAAVKEFCRGYVQLAQKDKTWKENMEAFALTIPFAILAGYVNPASLRSVQSTAPDDPVDFEVKHRLELAEDVIEVYRFFQKARDARQADADAAAREAAERQNVIGPDGKAEPASASGAAESDKVARNEPCPCGSGKKYKKCCGLPN
jgi:uncharacterized protein YecA (UPF0149 family)